MQVQPSYQGQPAQYGQPAPMKTPSYSAPRAKVPGVLMIVASAINLGFFIYVCVKYGAFVIWDDMIVVIIFYFIVGILAVISARAQRSQGAAIALIVMASLTIITCLTQMSYSMIRIIIFHRMYQSPYSEEHWIGYLQIILFIVAFITFCVCIALIVIASQAVCTCCGARPAQQSGVVYYQTTTAPTYQAAAQTK